MFFKYNLNQLALSLFGIMLVIQAGNFIAIENQDKNISEQHAWVIHTRNVIELSQNFLAHMINTETGQRGFLLTGQQAYLEPYNTGLSSAKADLISLKELTIDNPTQQLRLSSIEKLMDKKFDELKQTIDLERNNKREDALAIVEGNLGKGYMDSIRNILDEFITEEQRLLTVREMKSSAEQNFLNLLYILASLLLASITIAIAFIFKRRVIGPILKLTNEVKEKTPDTDIDTDTDEISELTFSFRKMYDTINQRNTELKKALEEVKTLKGIIPICSYCKKIRNDDESWQQMEAYIDAHSEAIFSHGICPDCLVATKKELKETLKNRSR